MQLQLIAEGENSNRSHFDKGYDCDNLLTHYWRSKVSRVTFHVSSTLVYHLLLVAQLIEKVIYELRRESSFGIGLKMMHIFF